jgi:hypothetical protein
MVRIQCLSGARVVISPSEKLNFEFLQIGQWGDQNDKLYSSNIDALLFRIQMRGKNPILIRWPDLGYHIQYL